MRTCELSPRPTTKLSGLTSLCNTPSPCSRSTNLFLARSRACARVRVRVGIPYHLGPELEGRVWFEAAVAEAEELVEVRTEKLHHDHGVLAAPAA